jgi:phenylalanyl-tRNA synthetase beta chain
MKADLEALLSLTGDLAGFEFRSGEHPALHPSRTALILRKGAQMGWIGELNPRLAGRFGLRDTMMLFEVLAGPALKASVPVYHGISKFPTVRRDLALLVAAEVAAADLIQTARGAVSGVLMEVVVFDIYSGGKVGSGQKSVAIGLILQDTSRTLTDADADAYTTAVMSALKKRFNARIRD